MRYAELKSDVLTQVNNEQFVLLRKLRTNETLRHSELTEREQVVMRQLVTSDIADYINEGDDVVYRKKAK